MRGLAWLWLAALRDAPAQPRDCLVLSAVTGSTLAARPCTPAAPFIGRPASLRVQRHARRQPAVAARSCVPPCKAAGRVPAQCASRRAARRAERSRSSAFLSGFVVGGVVFGALGFLFAPQVLAARCRLRCRCQCTRLRWRLNALTLRRSRRPCCQRTSGSSCLGSSKRRRRTLRRPGRRALAGLASSALVRMGGAGGCGPLRGSHCVGASAPAQRPAPTLRACRTWQTRSPP